MISDALLRVSDSQTVTTTGLSDHSIDLGANRDVGEGEGVNFVFSIITGFTGTVSTVTFDIITSASASLSSPTVVSSSGAVPVASLATGSSVVVGIGPQLASLGKRYLGVRYTLDNTATAGKVTADVTLNFHGASGAKSYPIGNTVV